MKQLSIILLISLMMVFSGYQKAAGETIKVGASPVVSSSGIFIAQEKGYFKERGLDVEVFPFRKSGAPMTVLLAKGDLDIGGGNLSTGLWNAINQGLNIRLVADKGHIEKDSSYIVLLVRSEHIKNGRYKSFSDLKGFKMGLTSLGGVSQEIAAERFLKKGNLKLSDVEFMKMSYSEMNVALEQGYIDATVQLEPYVAKAVLDGIAVKVAEVYDVYPDQQSAAIFFGPGFIKRGHEDGVKFMEAYISGVRDYRNAFLRGVETQETIKMLKKYIKIEDLKIWQSMIPIGLNPNGYIREKELFDDIKWYKAQNYIQKVPDLKTVIDHSYVDEALKNIGKVK